MSDLTNAMEAASLAVQFDQSGQTDKAVECYRTAARMLDRVCSHLPSDRQTELRQKVKEYLERATSLQEQKDQAQQEESVRSLQKCYFLMQQALDADEASLKDLALQLYTQAVELAVSVKASDPDIMTKVKGLATQALDRAEEIKGIKKMAALSITAPKTPAISPNRAQLQREQSVHLKVSGKQVYSEEEKEVLRMTSNINNNCFLPFMDIDLSEKFQYAIPFEDRASELKLSSKQAKEFDCWIRPHEVSSDPKMIAGDQVDFFSIKQTIVSDCSFVASLAVSALYERRFNKKIITSIIYPKNKNKQPVYNPFGKYMVKLHLNGVRRKIIIDDRLPYSKHGRLLCSYSSNKNEFWVSLLEKAYMKVMGGYDFPGSNSNIDLHALTGWIPERCAIRSDADFNADALYETVRTRLQAGHALASVATGALSDLDAERTGLVATHAYAVLDVRLVDGAKLLKLKNPWSHVRWRGNYSEVDGRRWTQRLRAELHYDPDGAAQYDDGVFWIDYKSILEFFDVFYLNWNPELFDYTYCIHQKWDAGNGPVKDAYTISANPQYVLRVGAGGVGGAGAVWLLLTRHITDIQDFRDNQEYITLLVYKNGRRVYYPYDPPPYIDGIRINSPHYLVKIKVGENSCDKYTLVVSQYEKSRTIFYTLRAYATCPFTMGKLEPYPYTKTIKGEWSGRSAGGCENHRQTYPNNPKYVITVPDSKTPCHVTVELKGPKEYQIGVDARVESLDNPNLTAPFLRESSGAYRSGFVYLELQNLPAGRYILTPTTFLPGQEGPFFLELRSTCNITAERKTNE